MDDLIEPDFLLHVLRNPHGHSEGLMRRVRRQAADQLEQQQATITELKSDYRILNHMYAPQQATITELKEEIKELKDTCVKFNECCTIYKTRIEKLEAALNKYSEDDVLLTDKVRIEKLEAILANIRALCSQENHDGYPWDEIYKMTKGEG